MRITALGLELPLQPDHRHNTLNKAARAGTPERREEMKTKLSDRNPKSPNYRPIFPSFGFRIGDVVRNKISGDLGTVDRTDLGAGMRDLVLVRFHNKRGVPQGDGLCIPRTQLEKVS